MTPAARHAAAIQVLDRIAAGEAAERALTGWARASRHAGSGDRAAVRDLVFAVLRRWRSTAALGGGETGRARILGLLRQQGTDPDAIFTGAGYAPAPLTTAEQRPPPELSRLPRAVRLDIPDWLEAPLDESLGADLEPVLQALRQRAPIFLRVNLARTDRAAAARALAAEGVATRPHATVETALEVTGRARRIRASRAFRDGLVELQDASSQAVVAALPLAPGQRVLDYCAGGGGKALAMAARGARVTAHDAAPRRMRDLPVRARRAGVEIALADQEKVERSGPWKAILCDVPCSGSGAWRRAPAGKWALDAAGLARLQRTQDAILDRAAALTARGGWLAYATCSVLEGENAARVTAFLGRHTGFRLRDQRRFLPGPEGDGMYLAILQRER